MKRHSLLYCLLGGVLGVVLTGCSRQVDEDIVASFQGGSVSRADIEAFDDAWPTDLTPVAHLGELLRQGVDRGMLPPDVGSYFASHWPELFDPAEEGVHREALGTPLTDEDVARQRALESLCLEQLRFQPEQMAGRDLPQLARQIHLLFQAMEAGQQRFASLEISEAELQRYYNSHQTDYRIPAGVDLRHLFLNSGLYDDRPSRAAPETEALADHLFGRLAEGEPFGRLIRRHSDSDTRERGGWLLEVEPGMLRDEVEQTLQWLEPGEISPPIKTPVGIHLVQLIERHPPGDIAFEQAREEIAALLLARQREALYRSILTGAAEHLPVQVVAPGLSSKIPAAVVLRVGEESYSLEEVQEELLALEPGFDQLDTDGQAQVVTQLGQAMLYLRDLEEQPVTYFEPLERRFKAQVLTGQFLSALAEQRLAALLGDSRQLRAFFRQQHRAYESPWQVRLSLAEIPLPDAVPQDPIGNYRRRQERIHLARQLIEQLQSDATGPSVEGIEIRSWRTQRSPRPLEELSQPLREAMISFIPPDPDSVKLPLLLDEPVEEKEHLLVVRVLELIPARQLTLEESLQQVRRDFAEVRRPEIIQQLREEILQEANFHLLPTSQDKP